jgi:hypothetical protein
MTVTENTPAPSSRLRIALIVIAAIEAAGALTRTPAIFFDYGHTTALLKFAQALGSVDIALAVPLTLAALYFAVAGQPTRAIIALAIRILVSWACDLPSIAIHGWELSLDIAGLHIAAARFGAPLIAAAAIWLALRNERLWLATILVALPTVFYWIGVAVFTIAIMIYGF